MAFQRENESWINHEAKEIGVYILWGCIVAILMPLFLGFVLQGFENSFVAGRPLQFGDVLVSYIIYYIMIVVGLIGLPTLKVMEIITTSKNDDIAKQSKPFPLSVAYMHDPEKDGALYAFFRYLGLKGKKNPMHFSLSMIRIFIIGTIIFGFVGLLQTINPNAQFVGIPQVSFQMTKATEVLFTAEPPAFAETTMMILILSLLMGLNAYICSKYKLPKAIFWILAFFIICPLIGVGWMGFHRIVYGNSDAKLFATFIFGWLGSTLTILFGTWILWYVWHFWNNIFAKLREILPQNEDVIFISASILALITVFYIGFEIWLWTRRRKKKFSGYEPPEPRG